MALGSHACIRARCSAELNLDPSVEIQIAECEFCKGLHVVYLQDDLAIVRGWERLPLWAQDYARRLVDGDELQSVERVELTMSLTDDE